MLHRSSANRVYDFDSDPHDMFIITNFKTQTLLVNDAVVAYKKLENFRLSYRKQQKPHVIPIITGAPSVVIDINILKSTLILRTKFLKA